MNPLGRQAEQAADSRQAHTQGDLVLQMTVQLDSRCDGGRRRALEKKASGPSCAGALLLLFFFSILITRSALCERGEKAGPAKRIKWFFFKIYRTNGKQWLRQGGSPQTDRHIQAGESVQVEEKNAKPRLTAPQSAKVERTALERQTRYAIKIQPPANESADKAHCMSASTSSETKVVQSTRWYTPFHARPLCKGPECF